jgi:hypothetical protein
MATAVRNLENQIVQVAFVLELYDGFTGLAELAGEVSVRVTVREDAWKKPNHAQFLFFSLAPGSYVVTVASGPATPYYAPASIPIAVPAAGQLWPAFPDRTVADPTKLLDDPTQTAAYLAQRAQATLAPTAQYPVPAGASLAGATVVHVGGTEQYVTGADGQFVLFFDSVAGTGQPAALQAVCAPHPAQTITVTLLRGMTVSGDIAMT